MENTFIEICIYEVKFQKINEFEALLKNVKKHHEKFPGVVDISYMKRTHRQSDFSAVKNGEAAIRLTRKSQFVTYVLYWELENEIIHGKVTKAGLEKFYKEFNRCLIKMPKIILGEKIL